MVVGVDAAEDREDRDSDEAQARARCGRSVHEHRCREADSCNQGEQCDEAVGCALVLDEYGNVPQVCCGTGKKNDLQYYFDRIRVHGDPHGQCAVLWCARALLEMKSETP